MRKTALKAMAALLSLKEAGRQPPHGDRIVLLGSIAGNVRFGHAIRLWEGNRALVRAAGPVPAIEGACR
jgi:hypothetical protein